MVFREPRQNERPPQAATLREAMEAAVQSNGQGPKGEAGSKPHPGLTLDPLQPLDGPEWLQTGLLESSQRLKPQEAQNYRRKALVISWLSILITLALAVAAFTVSAMRSSASAFGFGFDALLDVLSSAIVAWRYSNAAAVHSAMREYMACVVLGVVFIISSLCIEGKAIHDLAVKMLPDVDTFLFTVSILSGVLCLLLAAGKFLLGRVLTSCALITDGFNSLVGAVMGFSILASAEVFNHYPDIWYLDGSTGVLMGLVILGYGVKLLVDMVPRVRRARLYENLG